MKKLIKAIFISCIIWAGALLCLSIISEYLSSEISRLYIEKENDLSMLNGIGEKDKGNIWIRESIDNGALVVLGSSELSSPVPQNIKNNFPSNKYTGNISCIGHAYVQNALHAMNLGAGYESFKNADIVIIESIQWYFGDEINTDGFFSNFSELQFYEFINNAKISENNKLYLCNRFLDIENAKRSYGVCELDGRFSFLKKFDKFGIISKVVEICRFKLNAAEYNFPQTHLLAKLYACKNFGGKVAYQLLRPYYFSRYKILSLKDKYDTYVYLKSVNVARGRKVFKSDWIEQFENAEADGEKACTNNDIYVYDDYFTNYLLEDWESRKNSLAETIVLKSKEWADYCFLLSVCNELELKPYIINVSCNAYYYDYCGLDPEMRQEYYSKLEATAKEYGMDMYSGLKDKEYEPYVFADVMHLGWKGWIYVTQAITEYFKK